MSAVNIDYHNVKSIKILPVEINRLDRLEDGLTYSIRRIKIQTGDVEHDITLFGAKIDSLALEGEGCYQKSSATKEQLGG